MSDDIPDKNIFMMCEALDRSALCEVPAGYHVRSMRPDELGLWKALPLDDAATPETDAFMDAFFETTYRGREARFFDGTLFICDGDDRPAATCLLWRAYDEFESIHWLKTLKAHEGRGLGRAMLSILLRDLPADRYPIYLHTQPGSFRAIKLYSDFGFDLLSGSPLGRRTNDLDECLPILRSVMPEAAFQSLRIREAPEAWRRFLATTTTDQF
jgi:GNAT superfamily N-acetyltransferase